MFGIIFKIALCIGSLYIGYKVVKWRIKKYNKKEWDIKRESLLRNVMRINGNSIDIKKVAQVSFERFLKLYEVSPKKWIITNESKYTTSFYESRYTTSFYDEYFPVYKYEEGASGIPLFWETGEDLQKYREWVKEKFAKGEAALYQQARDESMKLLTKFIKEDIEAKRKRAEEEMAELEAQVKKECERAREKQKEIQLTLEPQTLASACTDEGEKPVLNELKYTTRELESPIETSVSQSAAEPSSTYIQPNQLDYDYIFQIGYNSICQIEDNLTQQLQMANMRAAQDYLLSQCQSSIMSQVQYNDIMQSTHPFHF